jgi:hypothetical protein
MLKYRNAVQIVISMDNNLLIVNMHGEVVGISQHVITAEVVKNTISMDGSARIGVTFGLLNHMFPEFIKKAKESLEKGSAYPSRFVYSGLTNLRVMKLSPNTGNSHDMPS